MFALAVCLSFLESLVPSVAPVPGIKLGLSNIVTMYAVFTLGARRAFLIAILKSLFALIVRGGVAAVLSLCGGIFSVTIMLLLLTVCGRRVSYAVLSMAGAVVHNLAQLAVAAAILRLNAIVWYYCPVLVASGVAMGLLTSILTGLVLPHLPTLDKRGDR